MLLVDTIESRIVEDSELKSQVSSIALSCSPFNRARSKDWYALGTPSPSYARYYEPFV